MKIDPSLYVRVGTAAKLAKITRAYVARLIHEGKLRGIEIDGQFFVKRTDAEAFQRQDGMGRPRKT